VSYPGNNAYLHHSFGIIMHYLGMEKHTQL